MPPEHTLIPWVPSLATFTHILNKMDDEEGGRCKLKEENETLKEELAILRKAYTIERIIGNMREDGMEDDQPIAELYGLATEEKEEAEEYEEDWKSQAGKEETIIPSDDEE